MKNSMVMRRLLACFGIMVQKGSFRCFSGGRGSSMNDPAQLYSLLGELVHGETKNQ